jgi:signal transduction histidine kinase
MSDSSRQSAFFGDRHTDARMRGLISRFARLGSYLTLLTAPFVADGRRLAFLLGNAGAALVVTFVADRFRWLHRATDVQLQALLLFYGILIANGSALAGGRSAPYLLMQALPVLFAAIFFPGRSRYVIAVAIGVEYPAVLAVYGYFDGGHAFAVLLLCLLVAAFGAQVSDVLREALAANRALHSVLEVSNDAMDSDRLPEIGLAAAVSVAGWDAGAVIVRDGDVLRIAAAHQVSDEVRRAYEAEPMLVDGPSMSAEVVRTGEVKYVADVPAFLGPDHPLPRDGVVCMTGLPIRYHGEIIGVLVMDNRTPRVPDERELDRLAQVAEQLGLALGNQRAYRRESQVADELRELNRRKDAFLATVSHELRTPATTITLAARTLRDSEARLDPADRAYAHDLLVRRSEEMTNMIESLLDEALAESDGLRVELAPLDWNADLTRWVEQARAQTGRTFTLLLPETPVTAMADRAKVERIVANLLSNAAKFSPAGTPITCALTVDDEWLAVSVRDAGPGVPPDARERIFDRFFQVDSSASRRQGGFGIGLSLVRRFTEAHGGTVSVSEAPGGGSVFSVRLPRATVPVVRHAAAPGDRSDDALAH